ncbi:Queuine tRNA-ribosyltransferase accessory subunit 2 [Bagarius yarrelli]|uniref:Queuine tRNA-ribosyltransferase accessory subunit 2 n=1 Tax=Bagarius yarrelli TaxID=175774 RepID=A0A556TWK2_BAGYA|nr:Queuine tRNA-ribosyltransferase accessory subunit 2 [Bagarius yarrelli]
MGRTAHPRVVQFDSVACKELLCQKEYRDDFRPLVDGCSCYCCKNHTRAYVHHLLVTNELLAGVLLMLHNTAHYLGFFQALRDAVESDRLQDLKRKVLK